MQNSCCDHKHFDTVNLIGQRLFELQPFAHMVGISYLRGKKHGHFDNCYALAIACTRRQTKEFNDDQISHNLLAFTPQWYPNNIFEN